MKRLTVSVTLSLLMVAGLVVLLGQSAGRGRAAGTLTVCPAGPPTCDYAVIQDAVDAAVAGDLIKIAAGSYTQVNSLGGHDQLVFINKSVTIRGGYDTSFAEPPDADSHPTVLDAQNLGRGVYVFGDITPTLENLSITNGDAGDQGEDRYEVNRGGGVFVLSATITIRNCHVYTNTAGTDGLDGGGIHLSYSDAVLVDNVIEFNQAGNTGGGVYAYNGAPRLEGNIISRNWADSIGAGVLVKDSPATLTGNLIEHNRSGRGGGIGLIRSTPTVRGNIIRGNEAYEMWGGGIYVETSDGALIVDNLIAENSAATHGGGIMNGVRTAIIWHNEILTNSAPIGGGMFQTGGTSELVNNTIRFNTATDGAGIAVDAGQISATANRITDNVASSRGGAVFLQYTGMVANFSRNWISANQASQGGAIFVFWWVELDLQSDILVDNVATDSTPGVYNLSGDVTLDHCTLARNTGGDGIGLLVENSGLEGAIASSTLTNTILVSQTVGVWALSDTEIHTQGTLWGDGDWANGTDWSGEGLIITGTVNIWGDPAFVDPDSGDYHITDASAALDAGVDSAVWLDFDHQPRPYLAPDIGADEYWPAGALKTVYLPTILR